MSTNPFLRQHILIGSEWCDADNRAQLEVTNPASGEVIGTVPDAGAEETRRAIHTAHETLAEARGEITIGANYLLWFAEEARRAGGEVIASNSPARRSFAMRSPVGVVGAITPWNFPRARWRHQHRYRTTASNWQGTDQQSTGKKTHLYRLHGGWQNTARAVCRYG